MAVGRYVLSADIWPELERTQPGAWGRIQLTDAIAELAKKQSVDAMLMTGDSYDCGKKNGLYASVREVWTTQPERRGEVP